MLSESNMEIIEKWIKRIYTEKDFGKLIALSLSVISGLITYLLTEDWMIVAFSIIILLSVIRIIVISTGIDEKMKLRRQRNADREKALQVYEALTNEEREIVGIYVKAGGSVLTWKQMNKQDVSAAPIESLIQRKLIWTSVTADGMTETFALDSNIFDIAYEKSCSSKSPANMLPSTT